MAELNIVVDWCKAGLFEVSIDLESNLKILYVLLDPLNSFFLFFFFNDMWFKIAIIGLKQSRLPLKVFSIRNTCIHIENGKYNYIWYFRRKYQ